MTSRPRRPPVLMRDLDRGRTARFLVLDSSRRGTPGLRAELPSFQWPSANAGRKRKSTESPHYPEKVVSCVVCEGEESTAAFYARSADFKASVAHDMLVEGHPIAKEPCNRIFVPVCDGKGTKGCETYYICACCLASQVRHSGKAFKCDNCAVSYGAKELTCILQLAPKAACEALLSSKIRQDTIDLTEEDQETPEPATGCKAKRPKTLDFDRKTDTSSFEQIKALSESDAAIVRRIGHFEEVYNANAKVNCICEGHGSICMEMKRLNWLVPEGGRRKMVHTPEGMRKHPDLCYSCLRPCSLGKPCACTDSTHKINAFYREENSKKLFRNNEITLSKLEKFFTDLEAKLFFYDSHDKKNAQGPVPTEEVRCVCGFLIKRTSECLHLTCPCGFNICSRCNYATFVPKGEGPNALVDHYSGYGKCAQFPKDSWLYMFGRSQEHIKYPCVEGSAAKIKDGDACCGDCQDCRDPTHRIWYRLFANNRLALQAIRCVLDLAGTPLFYKARSQLMKHRKLMSFTADTKMY